jgi:hypothetical protein|nr:MAG TPA: hypothetical protein [Caudoviricetes sp.]
MTAAKKDIKSSAKTSAAKPLEDTVTEDSMEDVITADNAEDVITADNAEDALHDASPELGLYAKTDILYKSRRYGLGDKLPTDEPEMIEAWLRAETAEWR